MASIKFHIKLHLSIELSEFTRTNPANHMGNRTSNKTSKDRTSALPQIMNAWPVIFLLPYCIFFLFFIKYDLIIHEYHIFQCISCGFLPKCLPVLVLQWCDLYMHKTMHVGVTNMCFFLLVRMRNRAQQTALRKKSNLVLTVEQPFKQTSAPMARHGGSAATAVKAVYEAFVIQVLLWLEVMV